MSSSPATPAPDPAKTSPLLPIGTRIVFLRDLDAGPTEESPPVRFASRGQFGTVIRHGCKEGHWVVADGWPAPFGAELGKEFVAGQDAPLLTERDLAAILREQTRPEDFVAFVRFEMAREGGLVRIARAVRSKFGAGVSLTRALGNIAEAVHGKARRAEFSAAFCPEIRDDNDNPTKPSTT